MESKFILERERMMMKVIHLPGATITIFEEEPEKVIPPDIFPLDPAALDYKLAASLARLHRKVSAILTHSRVKQSHRFDDPRKTERGGVRIFA